VEKLDKLTKYDERLSRIDVEVTHESNPRLAAEAERVEITARSKGPVIRAEAAAQDRYAALDLAAARLEGRLRRAADRRHQRRARANGREVPAAGAEPPVPVAPATPATEEAGPPAAESVAEQDGLIVREKTHHAAPMSLDQALYEMELVGHDFYLFIDEANRLPSVVYRRRGYQYGVIRLEV
jgi:ribosomal subunit interface protein